MTETEKKKMRERIKDYLQKFNFDKFDSEIKDKRWWIRNSKIASFLFGLVSLILAFWGEKWTTYSNAFSFTSFLIAGFIELVNELKLKPEKEELKDKKEEATREKTISIISEEKEKRN